MPTTNKSANVAKYSTYVANPLTLPEIIQFSREIEDTIYNSQYYDYESHIFEVEFDDYDAVVEYSIEWKRVLVTEFMGDRLYDLRKVGESIEVLSVHHYNGTPYPQMRQALNRILR